MLSSTHSNGGKADEYLLRVRFFEDRVGERDPAIDREAARERLRLCYRRPVPEFIGDCRFTRSDQITDRKNAAKRTIKLMSRWQPSNSLGAKTRLLLLQKAVAAHPGAGMPHYMLALELFRIEENVAGFEAFKRAMALLPPTPDQLVVYVKALLAQGRAREALTVLNDFEQEADHSPALLTQQGAALLALGQPGKAAEFLFAAIERDPGNIDAAVAIQSVLNKLKDWSRLLQFFDHQAQRNAVTIPAVYAKITGLMGLGRTEEAARLIDFDSFVSVKLIDPPPSFRDLSEFNAALASDIAAPGKIKLSDAPRLRLTGGVQIEDLEAGSSIAMSSLFAIFKREIDEYLVLGFNDTQDSHVHLNSSVAGVYYVAAPEALFLSDNEDGCLVIPSKLSIAGHTLPPGRYLKPIPGRLVLFPGYFPHQTTPIRCDGNRISIAFDVVPRPN
jgi:tetratricopeptide (TPR) repeat protein